MGIEANFGSGIIDAEMAAFQKRVEMAALFYLKALGEELAAYAKDHHSYTDQTSNLTNSIGYVVLQKDTTVYSGGFLPVEGENAGLKVALEMAKKTTSSFSLIIVAGMNYASYVEAKGYNVILPAELKAKVDFPIVMKKLKEKVESKASELFGI